MGGFLHDLASTGRLPLFAFLVGLVVGFVFIRISVRLIRANVRWWFGNVTPGGTHIHHVVFGVVFMLVGGVAGLAVPDRETAWRAALAALFGVGAGLVLDEFALILHLEDVYWKEQGRTSVDAVFVAVALVALLLLGFRPLEWDDEVVDAEGQVVGRSFWLGLALTAVPALLLAGITLLKGKIWTGLLGLFLLPLVLVGAIRLARPGSPWARWRYRPGSRKLARAVRREQRLRAPAIRAKIRVQELIAGRH